MIKNFINAEGDDWDLFVDASFFEYNTHVRERTGHTPFFLNFGREARRLLEVHTFPRLEDGKAWDVMAHSEELQVKLHEAFRKVEKFQTTYNDKMKKRFSKKVSETRKPTVGDYVLVTHFTVDGSLKEPKFSELYHGPYRVIRVGKTTIKVAIAPSVEARYHTKHCKLFVMSEETAKKLDKLYEQTVPIAQECNASSLDEFFCKNKYESYGDKLGYSIISGLRDFIPTDLLGKRISVQWTQAGTRGSWPGTVMSIHKRAFLVKYDTASDDGEDTYKEYLLGKGSATWKFLKN